MICLYALQPPHKEKKVSQEVMQGLTLGSKQMGQCRTTLYLSVMALSCICTNCKAAVLFLKSNHMREPQSYSLHKLETLLNRGYLTAKHTSVRIDVHAAM